MNELLSVKRVSEIIGLSDRTVSAMIKRDELPGIDLNQGTGKRPVYRVNSDDLTTWLASRKKDVKSKGGVKDEP